MADGDQDRSSSRLGRIAAPYRTVLRNRPLVRLLTGEFVSSIGDWLYLVAIMVVVWEATLSPTWLGVIGAVRVLPYVLLSLPAGFAADRFDRRWILIATDIARGAIMLPARYWPLGAVMRRHRCRRPPGGLRPHRSASRNRRA
jgi:hypothetical protein